LRALSDLTNLITLLLTLSPIKKKNLDYLEGETENVIFIH